MQEKALTILMNEHRAISAVLYCLKHMAEEWREGKIDPPFALFHSIFDYMGSFPNKFHHPKEDLYLFPMVLRRAPALEETIATLRAQHEKGDEELTSLVGLISDMESSWDHGSGEISQTDIDSFAEAVSDYVNFERAHAKLEATDVIPKARETFTPEDWARVEKVFSENDDPIFGLRPRAEFDGLFRQILSLAPAPLGYGERKSLKKKDVSRKSDTKNNGQRRHLLGMNWI